MLSFIGPEMMTTPVPSKPTEEASASTRDAVIRAVKTPLGFFSLVVLAVEAILGVVVGLSSGMDRTISIVGMIVLIGCLVVLLYPVVDSI